MWKGRNIPAGGTAPGGGQAGARALPPSAIAFGGEPKGRNKQGVALTGLKRSAIVFLGRCPRQWSFTPSGFCSHLALDSH